MLRSKSKRDINHRVIDVNGLIEDLHDCKSKLSLILGSLGHLLNIRVRYTAFHPNLVITLQPYDVKWLIPFVQLERSIES